MLEITRMTRVLSEESMDVVVNESDDQKIVGASKKNSGKKKKQLDVAERFRGEETPSPTKNLTDALVVPPIGRTNSFRRNVSNLSIQLEQTVIPDPRSPSRGPPLPIVEGFHRSTSGLSIKVEDIRLDRKSATEFGFPRPVEKVVVEKQRTVHFDKFVRIRSIDNEKIMQGRPLNRAPGRFPVAARHDARPKAADKGKRLQSLPSKKEEHASMVEDRNATSAPSKEQQGGCQPMPQINNLVGKEQTTATATSVNHKPSQEHLPVKQQQPQKPEMAKISPIEKERERKPQPDVKTNSDGSGRTTAAGAKDDGKRTVAAREERKSVNMPGAAGRSTQQDDRKRSETFTKSVDVAGGGKETSTAKQGYRKLPPDDHGPAEPPRLPSVTVPLKTAEPTRQPSPEPDPRHVLTVRQQQAEADRKRAREQKERQLENQRQKEKEREITIEASPRRATSEKTDKSWSTIKSSKQNPAASSLQPAMKSKTSMEISQVPPLEMSDRKRREVTIVDPKTMKAYDTEEGEIMDEAFMHEYEYKHGADLHSKTFNEMTDEEKIEYFRDYMKMRPEQIRELTFHPRVTEPKTIHRAYTGVDVGNWGRNRVKSSTRPKSRRVSVYKKVKTVAPPQRKAFVHSRLQGVVYRHINKVYGASPREEREKRFFEKLARVQMDDMQHQYELLADRERRTFEAKLRQRDQLKRVRKKFEEDSWRRFMTQYVTSKVVESEYSNRQDYGLPNNISRGRPHHANPYARSQRQMYALTPNRRQKLNQKKFSSMFKYNMGPEYKAGGKPMKFEGIDTVYIDTEDEQAEENYQQKSIPGQPKRKKQNVDAIMREAKRILDQSDNEDIDDEPERIRPKPRDRQRPARPRPQHRRSRDVRSDRDDRSSMTTTTKSGHTGVSGTSRTTGSRKPAPSKNIKDIISTRRKERYQATSFETMKENLLKDSDTLNRSNNVQKFTAHSDKSPDEGYSSKVSESVKSEENARPIGRSMRTPPDSPVQKNVTKTTVTKVTKTTHTGGKKDDDTVSTASKWKVNEGNVYLDHTETQMGSMNQKSDSTTKRIPSRTPSRVSKASFRQESKLPSHSESPTKDKNLSLDTKQASRAPSRISEQLASKENKNAKRAPSRTSFANNDASVATNTSNKTTVTTTTTTVTQENKRTPSNTDSRTAPKDNSSAVFLTQTGDDDEEKSHSDVTAIDAVNEVNRSFHEDSVTKKTPSVNASRETISAGRSSVMGSQSQNKKPSSILVSKNTPTGANGSLRESEKQPKRVSVVDNPHRSETPVQSDYRNMNGHASPYAKSTTSDKPVPKTSVTHNVNKRVTEKVVEHEYERGHGAHPNQVKKVPQKQNEPTKNLDNDALVSKKITYQDRNKQTLVSNPKLKRLSKDSGQTNQTRPSRSRTPIGDGRTAVNGDIKMNRDEYEKKNAGKPKKSTGRRSKSPGTRKRSSSSGRKGRGRKRSTSGERARKKSTSRERKHAVTPSRFPDIQKKNGKWEVSVQEEEKVTEVAPAASQWRDLVNKYIRQPSPKVGRTDDRSLLDSNLDTDDEDEDIFTRMQKRYDLSVNSDSDRD
ncbi:uncharacterized protein LOC128211208 isoform X4 [Mya arenaria]|uniref:uncharacterized protein LOC128211208 isoform X4 n=1 Tax=Mya arenaria TaxID=6604 RepID=UPI0022E86FB5|nr:uncharacterized protein LOC128211208 isoform X4 [Mya arenaria]